MFRPQNGQNRFSRVRLPLNTYEHEHTHKKSTTPKPHQKLYFMNMYGAIVSTK